jgi:hypothetical protein
MSWALGIPFAEMNAVEGLQRPLAKVGENEERRRSGIFRTKLRGEPEH